MAQTFGLDEAAILSLLEGCDMAENGDAIASEMVKSSDSPQRVSKRSSWRLQHRDELLMLRKAEKHLSADLQQLKHTMRMKRSRFVLISSWIR
ncbi:uncharacterized protein PITG_19709 [Phytophthora infestans T30-4]|uniref:Uncharacterized protein n=1 Tax=Phytophthora infestans (strain T30-4) TaxID=403677 RepID=D0P0X5_PHYIT|nr:uncharacterized protein PITG_19709 [Phytophthora infestans T30-4]EEY53683.1 hypothetical protein PITG_19709 [Phytophthora infestans T30-4]KAI9990572.1 hypothetical protein PInf_018126 [Phytophthora infestans]KAI9990612.1 hypothetical protein PInf_018166 [Phytophthora infestans]|eukprot:XP_002896037.1 hypothetical protein PITG_19709 [Phytophthora infestans T30-4]